VCESQKGEAREEARGNGCPARLLVCGGENLEGPSKAAMKSADDVAAQFIVYISF